MSAHCQARVWDNGDMTDCGKLALCASLCPDHLKDEEQACLAQIRKSEEAIRLARKRLAEINTEKG